jgi:hypothetical protein
MYLTSQMSLKRRKELVNLNLSNIFAFSAHCSSTRGHPLKHVKPHARVNGRMLFFLLRIVDVWNSLPADVVTSNTCSQFKRGLLNANLDKFLTVMLLMLFYGANVSDG